MVDPKESPDKYKLLDAKLAHQGEVGVEDYVLDRRKERASWSRISTDLYDLTGERVSDETLRRWFTDRDTFPELPPLWPTRQPP